MAAIYRSIQRCCCPDDTSSGTGSRHQLTQRLMPPKTVEEARSTAAHTPILMPETAGCLTMHLERHPATGRARLRMSVLRDLVTDDAVELLLSYSLRAIHIGEPFLALWDLRQCALPKTSQVWRCIQWGSRHKAALDSRMVSLVVLLGDSNTALRNVVQFVMRITMPAVPALVTCDETQALGFDDPCSGGIYFGWGGETALPLSRGSSTHSVMSRMSNGL